MTYQDRLGELALNDERIVILTAENRAAIRALPDRLGERFIDFGICEQTMIGAAAGLALRGRIPVVHALAAFLTMRAFEFIRSDVGIAGLPVKLVGAVPGFLSDGNGPTHQAIEDIGLMRGIPGMHIVCPADITELTAFLPKVIDSGAPTYIRFNPMPPCTEHTSAVEIGRAETLREGDDIAILTYGFILREVLDAEAKLTERGISCRVVNMRMLAPIDSDVILAAAFDCRLLVIVEDHLSECGLYSIVARILLEQKVMTDVLPISLRSWFRAGLLNHVLEHERFTGHHIALRILERLDCNGCMPQNMTMPKMFNTYL